jgi:hypothetical protein
MRYPRMAAGFMIESSPLIVLGEGGTAVGASVAEW